MPRSFSWSKNNELTDGELIQEFKVSGDLDILGRLYESYIDLVYGVCLKYLQNREDARDGVTSIFEKLIVEIPKHEIENFKSWLYVSSKNHCLMKIRSDKSETARWEKWKNEQSLFVETEQTMHPIDEEDQFLNKTLQECIKQLKGQQQECIHLFYFENRSYKEISKSLKLDEKKVKSFIQNGKRNLKICIENSNGK
jgi:RNA polymerase sigma-70 factor (ECF subfamily)